MIKVEKGNVNIDGTGYELTVEILSLMRALSTIMEQEPLAESLIIVNPRIVCTFIEEIRKGVEDV